MVWNQVVYNIVIRDRYEVFRSTNDFLTGSCAILCILSFKTFQLLIGSQLHSIIMSEKLCLQWNDFQENIKGAFGSLRGVEVLINKRFIIMK